MANYKLTEYLDMIIIFFENCDEPEYDGKDYSQQARRYRWLIFLEDTDQISISKSLREDIETFTRTHYAGDID